MPDTAVAKKIEWDKIGEHFYETGVDHGILSILSDSGEYESPIPWNGLTGVTESPSGAEANAHYADNIKYLNIVSAEDFGLTIEAFTYPKAFGACDGSAEVAPGVYVGQQGRKTFGFGYRSLIGNDVKNIDLGYKLHFVYGCLASPSEKSNNTISDSTEPQTLSWEVNTTPVNIDVEGFKPSASVTIDSRYADPDKLKALEKIVYGTDPTTEDGTDGIAPRFPLPTEIITMMMAG